jgi:hypothetical protein
MDFPTDDHAQLLDDPGDTGHPVTPRTRVAAASRLHDKVIYSDLIRAGMPVPA